MASWQSQGRLCRHELIRRHTTSLCVCGGGGHPPGGGRVEGGGGCCCLILSPPPPQLLEPHLAHGAAAMARPHQHEGGDPDQFLQHALGELWLAKHLLRVGSRAQAKRSSAGWVLLLLQSPAGCCTGGCGLAC